MKNYLIYTVILTIIIIGGLLALNKLPTLTIGDYTLRTVDILADVRKPPVLEEEVLPDIEILELSKVKDTIKIETDSLTEKREDLPHDTLEVESADLSTLPSKRIYANEAWEDKDTNQDGITNIVDYSDDSQRGMSAFFEGINKVKTTGEKVKIAVFGDSFIEGDIFTGDLRSYLQSEYGGCGVGFVPITSATNGFRPTVIHNFGGWESHSVTDASDFENRFQGVSGHYFIPINDAFVELRGQKRYASHLDTCQIATIFFKNHNASSLSIKVNQGEVQNFNIEGSDDLQSLLVEGNIGRVKWSTSSDSTALFYGVAMDGDRGVVLDNFSQRGSSGYSLSSIPIKNITDFNALRAYDLIILQYGLNVVSSKVYDYNYYRLTMNKVITYLKKCFPQAGFLLLGVADRDYKTEEGNYKTMPEIKYFLQIQRQIAKDNKIAFWNMFEAMGGDDSMSDLVHDNPPKANYDYTHINFRGGRFLARKLFDALKLGKSNFDNGEIYAGE